MCAGIEPAWSPTVEGMKGESREVAKTTPPTKQATKKI